MEPERHKLHMPRALSIVGTAAILTLQCRRALASSRDGAGTTELAAAVWRAEAHCTQTFRPSGAGSLAELYRVC